MGKSAPQPPESLLKCMRGAWTLDRGDLPLGARPIPASRVACVLPLRLLRRPSARLLVPLPRERRRNRLGRRCRCALNPAHTFGEDLVRHAAGRAALVEARDAGALPPLEHQLGVAGVRLSYTTTPSNPCHSRSTRLVRQSAHDSPSAGARNESLVASLTFVVT